MSHPAPDPMRRDALRHELLATVDLLKRRRAGEIAEASIDDYVTLQWLEWHGGSLRLTITGENLCRQMTSVLDRAPPRAAA